jgi:tRNA-specific 2-thiouridylase
MVGAAGEALGSHRGVAFYTVGQRRGLGVAAGERRYVRNLDAERNLVVLGSEADLYTDACLVEDVHLISIGEIGEPIRVTAKYRYKTPETPATVSPDADSGLRVAFDKPQRAVTPGQSIVFYNGDVVVGGGVIAQTR